MRRSRPRPAACRTATRSVPSMPFAPVTSHFTTCPLLGGAERSVPYSGADSRAVRPRRLRDDPPGPHGRPGRRSSSGSAATGSSRPPVTGSRWRRPTARSRRRAAVRGIHFADCRRARPSGSPACTVRSSTWSWTSGVGSPTFGQWEAVLLDDTDRRGDLPLRGPRPRVHGARGRQLVVLPLLGAVRARAASTACTRSTRRSASSWPTTDPGRPSARAAAVRQGRRSAPTLAEAERRACCRRTTPRWSSWRRCAPRSGRPGGWSRPSPTSTGSPPSANAAPSATTAARPARSATTWCPG